MELELLKEKKVAELREILAALGVPGGDKMKKKEIIELLTRMHEEAEAARAAAEAEKADAAEAVQPVPETEKAAEEAPEKIEAAEITAEKPVDEVSSEEKPKKRRGRPSKAEQAAEKAAEAQKEEPSETIGLKAEQAFESSENVISAAEESVAQDEKRPTESSTAIEELPQKDDPASEKARSVEPETSSEDPTAEIKPASEESPTEEPKTAAADVTIKEKPANDNKYETTGILELAPEGGFGFLRFDNFLSSDADVYVSNQQIRRFNLKTGDEIYGVVRKPQRDERFGALLYVHTVNGDDPGTAIRRRDFSELTPVFPNKRIRLEEGSSTLAMRLTDLVAPIGFGQRGLIVAPPKAGKTTLLKQIAAAIEKQHVNAELIVLLIDERPEEVTDMQRSIEGRVLYSTFDEQPSHHVKVAEMALARAMRLVEHKKDVIILLDSITRLARAYNLVEPPSGRTLSGGLDPAALYKPKKFFGAARNIEEGGSITILATALVETGSRMDDMIFEEFKGTGNMELHLDRNLSERRIFPALNLPKSGTRREDMLMTPEELEAVYMMRRAVADMGIEDATEKIIFDLIHTKNNRDFVERFRKMRL